MVKIWYYTQQLNPSLLLGFFSPSGVNRKIYMAFRPYMVRGMPLKVFKMRKRHLNIRQSGHTTPTLAVPLDLSSTVISSIFFLCMYVYMYAFLYPFQMYTYLAQIPLSINLFNYHP